MATILDLTQQGDVATIGDDTYLRSTLQLMTPQQLYGLWERQQWQSQTIDLERDKREWPELSDSDRDEFIWGMSAFFVGEERVTTEFSGLVMAYDDESEAAFLATQQVDEARHMQFFDRYAREVLGYEDADLHARLQRMREHLTEPFVKLFDESLVEHGRRLIENPRDVDAKVDFVTTYHMVIEGTLALTGQYFFPRYFEENSLLPGFVEGFQKIARDEHRHVAWGTWYLQKMCREERYAKRVQDKLMELLPVAAGVLVPPGFNLGDDYTVYGYTAQEQNEYAFTALSRRLKVIGVGLPVVA
jgi:ribonucleoside-diphosphate reductase beta chain